jgi:hypothetical protein
VGETALKGAVLRQVNDHDFGRASEQVCAVASGLAGVIDAGGALPSIEGFEAEGGAEQIAAGRFDLDHVGAVIGEEHDGVWAGDTAGKVDHPDAAEGATSFAGSLLVGRVWW